MLTDYTMSATQNGSADTFRLVKSGSNVLGYVNESLNQTMPIASLGRITINGSSDNDTLTIDSSGGAFSVPDGVAFNAGSGTDTLVAQSQTSNGDVMSVTPTTAGAGSVGYVAADGTEGNLPTVTYSSLENITLTGQSGDGDTFAVDGSAGSDAFVVNEGGSAGSGTVTASLNGGAYSLPTITFSGMSATSENVINSAGLTNGGGADAVTLNCTSSGDTINASPGFDDGMFLSVNTSGDRLKIRADNMLQINIVSGDGNDTINISGGVNVAVGIDGGGGTDAIHLSNSPDPDALIYSSAHAVSGFGYGLVTYANVESIDGVTSTSNPMPPVANPVFWVDASTLNLSNGAAVSSLSDLSGHGNTMTAGNYGQTGTVTFNASSLNGKGTIHFSEHGNLTSSSALAFQGSENRSIFVVMRRCSPVNDVTRISVTTGVPWNDKGTFGIDSHQTNINLPTVWNHDVSYSPRSAGTFEIYEIDHQLKNDNSGDFHQGFINGTLMGTTTYATDTLVGPVILGSFTADGWNTMNGDIAEVLIYDRVLSDYDRDLVEAYLNSKWFAVNATPTLDSISDPAAIPMNSGQQTVYLTGITAGGSEQQALQVTATSDNTNVIPNPSVSYTSPASTGAIQYTPVSGQSGTAHLTVTVRDAGSDGTLGNGDDATVS